MNSAKGFLASRGEGLPPRMTGKQQIAILDALIAVRDEFNRTHPPSTMADGEGRRGAEAVITSMIEAYPVDRSCLTCDFSMGNPDVQCQHWKQEVPDANVESGCDNHQDDGAPF